MQELSLANAKIEERLTKMYNIFLRIIKQYFSYLLRNKSRLLGKIQEYKFIHNDQPIISIQLTRHLISCQVSTIFLSNFIWQGIIEIPRRIIMEIIPISTLPHLQILVYMITVLHNRQVSIIPWNNTIKII